MARSLIVWLRRNWEILAGCGAMLIVALGVAGDQAVQASTIRENKANIAALQRSMDGTSVNIAIICTLLADLTGKPVQCIIKGE